MKSLTAQQKQARLDPKVRPVFREKQSGSGDIKRVRVIIRDLADDLGSSPFASEFVEVAEVKNGRFKIFHRDNEAHFSLAGTLEGGRLAVSGSTTFNSEWHPRSFEADGLVLGAKKFRELRAAGGGTVIYYFKIKVLPE